MKKTDGHWALSGPGWAAEWNQGGESGFLSIATAVDDDRPVATKMIEIPVAGEHFVWVRYGDWREKTERFQITLEQQGSRPWTARFGEQPRVEEDNVMRLYFGTDPAETWLGDKLDRVKFPYNIIDKAFTKDLTNQDTVLQSPFAFSFAGTGA